MSTCSQDTTRRSARHRAAVAVFVTATVPVLLGFAVLAVDVGVLFNARTDLQNAADAGAMSAANVLMNEPFGDDAIAAARAKAAEVVEWNHVVGKTVTLDLSQDVVFGRANLDRDTNTYDFTPTTVLPDCVRVTVRCTSDSPNGPVELFFAPLFGETVMNISATATAAMAPRDIAIAADLSGSIRYDSQLKRYAERVVNFYDVWDALPGGALDMDSTWAAGELPADLSQASGPGWGYFKELLFGTDPADETYDPATDSGMITLSPYAVWNDADLTSSLFNRGYNSGEVDAIMQSPDYYHNRVAVAMGLAFWNSGIPGGLWESRGLDPACVGNGNQTLGPGELEWSETILSHTQAQSVAIWQDYIGQMTEEISGPFRYRFGIKTFVAYLIDERVTPSETPELADVPLQPLYAVKESVAFLTGLLDSLEAADQISLEVYNQIGVHEIDLTRDYESVSARLSQMHPDHYGTGTNIGGGLQRAIEELTGPRARATSRKVIVLLTDGYANRDEWGNFNETSAKAYALRMAVEAADKRIQIVAVTVGQDADELLIQQIADIGDGVHLHAEGSIDEYSADLTNIFAQIGTRRTVELIE